MRRPVTESYTIVPNRSADGVVICFQRGRRLEYLGTDKLWHRTPQHCDPFNRLEDAAKVITQLQEEHP